MVTQTTHFAEMFDRFFDSLNSSSRSAEKGSKSPNRSGTDWKLKVIYGILLYRFYMHSIL